MTSDKYEIYKNRIEKEFEDACNSLSELDESNANKNLLDMVKNKMSLFFNDMDFVSADACSLHDTERHEVGKWFADTSKDGFIALSEFYRISKKIDSENAYLPSEKAFASMQRLIKLYLPKEQIDNVINKLSESGITTVGFTEKHKFRMTKTHERLLSIALAILSVIFMTVLITNIQEPSPLKYNFYCVLISILAGYAASVFTGTLDLKTNKIKARSGYAVFFIILATLQGIRIFS